MCRPHGRDNLPLTGNEDSVVSMGFVKTLLPISGYGEFLFLRLAKRVARNSKEYQGQSLLEGIIIFLIHFL
jgi:hypothetical protein